MSFVSIVSRIFIILAAVFLAACSSKKVQYAKPVEVHWGLLANEKADTMEHYSLKEILENGEIIALTIAGEDTYYSFKNAALGVQYMIGEKFASDLGVSLRVEACTDTLELVAKLRKGEGDLIMMPVRRDISGADSLVFCGPEQENSQWAVMEYNKELADTIDHWFKPEMIEEAQKHEEYILNNGAVKCHAYSPYIDKEKGVISEWDYLFKAYAQEACADWRLLAAICYQESCFDPMAKSWAGACGLMQLMPVTAQTYGLEMEKIFDPESNVATAAQVVNQLLMMYRDVPDNVERLNFVLASYNGGPGHVRDAMALTEKYGGDKYVWEQVAEYILLLSDPKYYRDAVVKYGYMRGTETFKYVTLVRERFEDYIGEKLISEYVSDAPQPVGDGYAGVSTEPTRRVAKNNKFQI